MIVLLMRYIGEHHDTVAGQDLVDGVRPDDGCRLYPARRLPVHDGASVNLGSGCGYVSSAQGRTDTLFEEHDRSPVVGSPFVLLRVNEVGDGHIKERARG